MIYNLVQYLITNLPSFSFVANGLNSGSPNTVTIVSDTGGMVDHNTGRKDFTVQILSRSKDNFTVQKQSQTIFDLINNKFGLILPEVTVSGTVFPEIKTYRIVSLQAPGYIGTSEDNYEMYSFNVIITLNYS